MISETVFKKCSNIGVLHFQDLRFQRYLLKKSPFINKSILYTSVGATKYSGFLHEVYSAVMESVLEMFPREENREKIEVGLHFLPLRLA